MKLQLLHPITVGNTQLTELTLRGHTVAGDYLAFDQRGGVAQRIALIANMAGTAEEIVKRLHGADYRRAEAHIDKMLAADDDEANQAMNARDLEKKKRAWCGLWHGSQA
jgi:hypothetical protein